ncbi:MAG: DnaJ family domain-containing protein [Chloroflexota bacterium]
MKTAWTWERWQMRENYDEGLVDIVAKIADAKIRKAMEDGEFENLPGQGRPLELEDLSAIPEEYRAGYKVLKNAGIVPQEVQLRKEMADLQDRIAMCQSRREREALRRKLEQKTIHYNVLMERRRKR